MIESPDAPAIDAALVDRARRAAERIAPHAAATEAARQLAPEALAALVDAGVARPIGATTPQVSASAGA